MDSIFVLTKTNFEFFNAPASIDKCKLIVGTSPYWLIVGRVCYHYGEPAYIIHNNVVLTNVARKYDGFFHVENVKKPLYAISHYSLCELKEMAEKLMIPVGTKTLMYASISKQCSVIAH